MAWVSPILYAAKSVGRKKKWHSSFLDSLRIHVQGGAGGMGHPKYGGVGGRGGRVFVEAKEDMTLKQLKTSLKGNQRVKASVGQNSSSNCILARPGNDVVIECPTGVAIVNELGNTIGEVLQEGDTVLVADGGAGGCSANGFSGTKGQAHTIRLDLKLIADVAFLGFPNAGKSTLLSRLSRASPKIASYPFTTLRPTVGLVEFPDKRRVTLADLPGLIEGSHVNRGLGHHFLRHTERSTVLLLLADVTGFQLSHKYQHRSCVETILLLNKELELYKEYLVSKPIMLLINKMDKPGAKELFHQVLDEVGDLSAVLHKYPEEMRPDRLFDFVSIRSISAKEASEDEMNDLKSEIRRVMDWIHEENERQLNKEAALHETLQRSLTEYGPKLC